ncbi:hypothetical protein LSM04_007930 [Trypanosoma melophagium]|uniref:uncharacterized protein n=1 Tax=Trypanosoma melophagium TaxID=715481 RepID=UPI00351A2D78|nr:hypothetical protein LSM04_007930 [Trypanosoma melophagium]
MLTIPRLPSSFITPGLLLLLLLSSLALTCHATPDSALLSVAGSVVVPVNATPFMDVQVVDTSSGAVLRSFPLDATRTFAFAGLPPTAAEVRLFLRLPERRFRLSPEASTLATPIPKAHTHTGGAAWLQLTAAVEEVEYTAAGGQQQQQQESMMALLVTVVGLALAVVGRHKLIAMLHLPAMKLPKPRKMVVPMSR